MEHVVCFKTAHLRINMLAPTHTLAYHKPRFGFPVGFVKETFLLIGCLLAVLVGVESKALLRRCCCHSFVKTKQH